MRGTSVSFFLSLLACNVPPAFSQPDPIEAYRLLRIHEDLFEGLDMSAESGVFDPEFQKILEVINEEGTDAEKKEALLRVIHVETPGVFSFPVFTPAFARSNE